MFPQDEAHCPLFIQEILQDQPMDLTLDLGTCMDFVCVLCEQTLFHTASPLDLQKFESLAFKV